MKRRLLLDEMFSRQFAEQLRGSGVDATAVVTNRELVSAPDEEVLGFATGAGRCLMTRNDVDFMGIAQQWALQDTITVGSSSSTTQRFPTLARHEGKSPGL